MDKNKIYEDFPRLKEKIETITRNFATLLERLDLIRSLDYRSEDIESRLEHALVHQLELAAETEFKYGKVGIDEVDDTQESELQDS